MSATYLFSSILGAMSSILQDKPKSLAVSWPAEISLVFSWYFFLTKIWATQFGLGLGKQGNSQEDEQNAAVKSISMVGVLTMLGLLIGVCFKGELKRSKLDQ